MLETSDLKICVVGLGYVGLPLAVAFAKNGFSVCGFDVNQNKVQQLQQHTDASGEIPAEVLRQLALHFSADPSIITPSHFIIVAVPTPVTSGNKPDFTCLEEASRLIGKHLRPGTTVVYESTVYPGLTEEVCLPLLEQSSGLRCGLDFKIGYSPERINPGDREHTLESVVKIVAGMDAETTEQIAHVYGRIVKAGIHKAPNIKTAEAAKVIENIQRDLNIALVNELALIFDRLEIKTKDVLEAAGTKWNFHKYFPSIGPGGHCIPVDPYYLTYKAEQVGYNPQVILAGRAINNQMAKHVAELTLRALNAAGKIPRQSCVLLLGLTFKEDVRDPRNSRAVPLIKCLQEYGITVLGCDPFLEKETVATVFGIDKKDLSDVQDIDGIILVTLHQPFRSLALDALKKLTRGTPFLVDTRSFFQEAAAVRNGFIYAAL